MKRVIILLIIAVFALSACSIQDDAEQGRTTNSTTLATNSTAQTTNTTPTTSSINPTTTTTIPTTVTTAPTTIITTQTTTTPTTTPKPAGASLIIYGKDVTAKSPVVIDFESNHNPGLPLTLILDELGCTWAWEDENHLYFYLDSHKFTLDLTMPFYGWPIPPGSTNAPRDIVAGEVIIDAVSIFFRLRNYGHFLYIDIDNNVVVISDVDGPLSR